MSDPDLHEAQRKLRYALENYPERVLAIPAERALLDSTRQNAKRPATVKLAVPDDVVKALRGPASKRRDLLLLVSIPAEVLDRAESPIILPGEAGT